MHLAPRSRVRLGMTAALAAAALALTACSGGGSGSGSAAAPDLSVVRIDMPTTVTSLDPIADPYLIDSQIVALTSATLFRFVTGSATQTEPFLADSLSASADLTTYTVKLKSGLTFSDGTPLTAQSVAASLLRLRDTPGPDQDQGSTFASVTATDDTTVTIALTQPVADLAQYLAVPATGIVAPGAADAAYFTTGTPAFSGPYVPEGDVTSSSYALVRNDAFGGPKPAVQRLEFSVVADTVTSATRLQGGDIDLAPTLPVETVAQITGDLTATSVDRVASLFIVPNNRAGSLFSDVRLRQALAWAIDRAALATVVYGDRVTVQSGPYPGPADYPAPVEVYGRQDIDRAKSLLKGTACENGCSFTATYFSIDSEQEGRAAVALQQQLAEIGMTVQAQPVEPQQFIQNSLDGSFDLNVVESGGFNVPSSFSGAFDTEATQCIYSGCSNDAMQPAVSALLGATDATAQAAASTTVLDVFADWTPIVPVAASVLTYGTRTSLKDVVGLQPNALFWIADA